MLKNRISQFYETTDSDRVDEQTSAVRSVPPTVPPGFVAIPTSMFGSQLPGQFADPQQIYHLAYESAKRQAQDRLLKLLQSRWN